MTSYIKYLIPRIFNNAKKLKWAWSKLVLNRKWAWTVGRGLEVM